jgi:hypothetical protein
MENQKVTLTISTDRNESLLYTSDVRVFKLETGQLRQFKQIEYNGESELFLGTLNELKDAYLIVDTFARKANDYSENKTARINYEIKYGERTVEKTTIESHFIDRTLAFLGFRFRFCPRHPFC